MHNSQLPYKKSHPHSIKLLFNSIAARYDFGNSLLSFHTHTLWNQRLVTMLCRSRDTATQFLDLCAGTGEIALRSLQYFKKNNQLPPYFTLVDFSTNMLKTSQERIQKEAASYSETFSLIEADVTELPLVNSSYEKVSMAYGIRNIYNVEKCFQEVYRVMQPNGSFGILELTKPSNAVLRTLHTIYLKTYVPLVGRFLANKDAYSYLCESIGNFPEPKTLVAQLQKTGFSQVETTPLFGGIATIFLAKKL